MRTWRTLLALAALAACSGKDKDGTVADDGNLDGDADTDADSDSDTDADTDVCASSIVAVEPAPNAAFVPLDAVVTVDFDVPLSTNGHYAITLDDGTNEVAGTTDLSADRLSMTFTPDAPLAPETVHTVDAEVCTSTESGDFTTLPPPVDTSAVEGNTYGLLWDDLVLTEPGNPALLRTLVDVDFILLQIDTIDPVTLGAESYATIGTDDGAGNPIPECDTVVTETADFSLNPYFLFTGDLQIVIDEYGTTADVEDFVLQARVEEDGSALTDVRLSGLVAPEQFLDGEDCNGGSLVQLLQPTCLPCSISTVPPYECMLLEGNAVQTILHPGVDIALTCGL